MKLKNMSRMRIILIVVAVLLLAGAGTFFGFYAYAQNRALPGTYVGDIPVGGKSAAEIEETLSTLASAQNVVIQIEDVKSEPIGLATAGVSVDTAATTAEVFERTASVPAFAQAIFERPYVEPVVTVDEKKLKDYTAQLKETELEDPVEAAVHLDVDSGSFIVQEGRVGQQIDREKLLSELQEHVLSSNEVVVKLPLEQEEPEISAEAAGDAAKKANQFLESYVEVIDEDWDSESPDRAVRASWIEFKPQGKELHPTLNDAAVTEWAQAFANLSTRAPVTGLRNVDAAGEQLALSRPAQDGYGVTNVAAVAGAFDTSLQSGEPASFHFEYGELPATWEDRPALEGTEGWVYRPAAGEKWIDLDLGSNAVIAYEGTEPVLGSPWGTVPGAPLTPTVTGEYNVYWQTPLQDMSGLNYDGSRYHVKDVPWVTYFYEGYAFHGAPWFSSFGWSGPGGSHGCLNMAVPDAKLLYEWAEVGTKVISHY